MGEEKYRSVLRRLEQSLAEYAWDENWFLRGFYDDGAPLGKKGADACAIDLLPQAFAALLHRKSAGTVFSPAQVKEALDSAIAKLFVPQRHLLRPLTVPSAVPVILAAMLRGCVKTAGNTRTAQCFSFMPCLHPGATRRQRHCFLRSRRRCFVKRRRPQRHMERSRMRLPVMYMMQGALRGARDGRSIPGRRHGIVKSYMNACLAFIRAGKSFIFARIFVRCSPRLLLKP